MGQFYEVQFANKLDGNDDYGNVTYSVKFQGEQDSALWKMQPKNAPKPGDKVFGTIEVLQGRSGKDYRKFKRETPPDAQNGAPQASVQRKTYTEKQSDKQDEIHQGRCYNNAAVIVAACIQGGFVEPDREKIAEIVQEMAETLYNLPPLSKTAQRASTQPTEPVYDPPLPAQQNMEVPMTMQQPDKVVEPTQEELANGVDMSNIDKMFPGNQPVELKNG